MNITYTIHGNILKSHTKNKTFKISDPKWNDKFQFPEGSYSVSDIQANFEYIEKKIWRKER